MRLAPELQVFLIWLAFLVVWALACWRLNRLGESHHFWYGTALVAFAALPDWLRVIGGIALVDDACWHAAQAMGVVAVRKADGSWNDSPLHTIFYRIFKGAP